MVNLFQTSPSYSYDHCRQFALEFVSFGYVGSVTLRKEVSQKYMDGANLILCCDTERLQYVRLESVLEAVHSNLLCTIQILGTTIS